MRAEERTAPNPVALPLLLAGLALLWAFGVRQWRVEWEFNPLYSYGWAVPFLVAWLSWRECEHLPPASPGRGAGWIVLAAALALLPLRVVLEANPDWRMLPFALALLIVVLTLGCVHRLGGWAWTRAFLPIVGLILFAMPWPQAWEYAVVQHLTNALTSVTVEFLNLLGIAAVQRGNVIEVAAGLVGVSDACSGIRSLQATLMLAAFLGQLFRLGLLQRLLLFPIGFAVAAVTNVVRTLFLSFLAARRGSVDAWHDPAGFMILAVCFVILWWIGSRWRREDDPAPSAAVAVVPPPLLWGAALCVWVAGVEALNAAWYRAHERSQAAVPGQLWRFEYPTTAIAFAEVPIPEDARIILRANEQRAARWEDANGVELTAVTLRWEPSRVAAQLAHQHQPEVCYAANGHAFAGAFGLTRIEAPRLPAALAFSRFLFRAGARQLYVFRCLTEDGARAEAPIRGAEYGLRARLQAALEGRRNLGQRSLELTVSAPGLDEATALAIAREVVALGVGPDRPVK